MNNASTITADQLRELHLNSLQALHNLSDEAVGGIEIAIMVALSHQAINHDTHIEELRQHVLGRLAPPDNYDVGYMAMLYIKELEEATRTLGAATKTARSQQEAAETELAILRTNYANLSDNLLEAERDRDRITEELNAAKRENALLQYRVTEANKTIADAEDALVSMITSALDGMVKEAGTAAAANPPAQTHAANLISPMTPGPYSKDLARLAGEVDAAAAEFQTTNGNGRNGSNGNDSKPRLVSHPTAFLFPTAGMHREMQGLIAALREEQIEWKSLTTEQKKQLGIEVAAEILVQAGNAEADLSRELFDSQKPTWMPTMHALCLGTPVSASYLRASAATLAASRLQNQQASNSASQAPSQDANQAPSQEANQDANQGNASSSDGSAPSSSD